MKNTYLEEVRVILRTLAHQEIIKTDIYNVIFDLLKKADDAALPAPPEGKEE
jgi:hypothetical protein